MIDDDTYSMVQFADGTFSVKAGTQLYFNFATKLDLFCWCERGSLHFINGECKGAREEAQRVYNALTEQETLATGGIQ